MKKVSVRTYSADKNQNPPRLPLCFGRGHWRSGRGIGIQLGEGKSKFILF